MNEADVLHAVESTFVIVFLMLSVLSVKKFIKSLLLNCYIRLYDIHVTVQGAFSAPPVILLCWQLVDWAICADRAAGVHGSRADSPPPVAHSPSPIYVSVSTTRCE